mmetsp:Transcript_8924/g.24870  ORF Transcript_8924/g.24870 Transcript_8924/m.24870 type:complete len:224 (-) Transcript_8924:953-1624(-)
MQWTRFFDELHFPDLRNAQDWTRCRHWLGDLQHIAGHRARLCDVCRASSAGSGPLHERFSFLRAVGGCLDGHVVGREGGQVGSRGAVLPRTCPRFGGLQEWLVDETTRVICAQCVGRLRGEARHDRPRLSGERHRAVPQPSGWSPAGPVLLGHRREARRLLVRAVGRHGHAVREEIQSTGRVVGDHGAVEILEGDRDLQQRSARVSLRHGLESKDITESQDRG